MATRERPQGHAYTRDESGGSQVDIGLVPVSAFLFHSEVLIDDLQGKLFDGIGLL